MEFDKTRVYTVLNAEDLPIGSECIFARTIFDLRKEVECDFIIVDTLKKIADDSFIDRFENDNYEWYPLAYLIELPKGKILALIAELETFTKVVQKKNLQRLLK